MSTNNCRIFVQTPIFRQSQYRSICNSANSQTIIRLVLERMGIGENMVAQAEKIKMLTPREAAEELGVSRQTISIWLRAGRILGAQRTSGGHWVIESPVRLRRAADA